MNIQPLLSKLRRADSDFKLIEPNDRITVGLSGGKDSLLLVQLLSAYKRFSPNPFTLNALTVDMGLGCDFSPLGEFCEQMGVEWELIKTDIAAVVFDVRKESNPCSLCAKMRRGALANAISERKYNALALGHHADDFLETFLLSLFYEGRLSVLQPKSLLSRTGVKVIRPMIYIPEKEVSPFVSSLPIVKNPCPQNGVTKRQDMKEFIARLKKEIPISYNNMLKALTHPERNNLLDKLD